MDSSVLTTKGQIVIPKAIRERYKLTPGTKLIFKETETGLMLQPVDASFINSLRGIAKSNDPRPMKIWWAEYKQQERELEERKLHLQDPQVKYKTKLKSIKKNK